ncbi:MAG: AI-2E family transporter [Parcubacteria group bacterium]|nr:AI-2E family transporter [Parcubacteria group bacterium]
MLTFFVYQPFLNIIALAAILSVLLHPFYAKILEVCRGKKNIAAVLVIGITLMFVAAPLYFLGTQIFHESRELYLNSQANNYSGAHFLETVNVSIERPMKEVFPNFSLDLSAHVQKFIDVVSENLGPLVSGTAFAVFGIFLVIVSLFFFLKEGEQFVKLLTKISPLDDKYDWEILRKMQRTINSVLRGTLFIALVQGFLVGMGLFIFGVPNAALWGTVGAITALIPGIGTAIVTVPSILYLLLIGSKTAALGLFLWGALLVGLIDNLLAPVLYSKGIEVHPLFVLFSVLGGLSFFGPMGLLFGPVILSAFLALLHIYRILILDEKEW